MSKLIMLDRKYVKFKLYEDVVFGWRGKGFIWEGIIIGFTRLNDDKYDDPVFYAIETPEESNNGETMIVIRPERDIKRADGTN